MWFYGMVGNSQFRDPWLDEAFATYAEALVNPESATELAPALGLDGDVGAGDGRLPATAGTSVSSTARGRPHCWPRGRPPAPGVRPRDPLLRRRRRLDDRDPDDLRHLLDDLPDALRILNRAGALGKDDVPR